MIHPSRRKAGFLASFALLALIAVQPAGARAVESEREGVRVLDVAERPGEAREYWTPARMRRAKPASRLVRGIEPPTERVRGERGIPTAVPPAPAGIPAGDGGLERVQLAAEPQPLATDRSGSSSSYPERTHGKVFFTVSGGSGPGDYQCSATAVRSPSHTLVFTAGHCVYDSQFGGGAARNWVFIPGYRDGNRPYGTWSAHSLYTTAGWQDDADERFDAGAATVGRDREGRGVQDVVGARGIAFNQPRNQFYVAYGYPAVRPFSGSRLYSCGSRYAGDDTSFPPPRPIRIRCDMTGGASGGGWVVGGRYVVSHTSYAYECVTAIIVLPCDNSERGNLFGPYFGNSIQALYRRARGSGFKCAGAEVTNLGYDRPDDYTGTARDESFKLRGGPDRASGAGGADRLCGGKGRDRLKGGVGRDNLRGGRGKDALLGGVGRDDLRGGRGKDVLVGGPGRDVCRGGRGLDRAFGCEVKKKIRR